VKRFLFPALVLVLSSVFALLLYSIDSDSTSMFQESRVAIVDQQEKRQAINGMMRAARERSLIIFSIYSEPDVFVRLELSEQFNEEAERFTASYALLSQSHLSYGQQLALDEVLQLVRGTAPKLRETVSLFLEEKDELAVELMFQEVLPNHTEIMSKLDVMQDVMDVEVEGQLQDLQELQNSTRLHVSQLLILFAVVFVIAIVLFQLRARAREINLERQVEKRTRELSEANTSLKRLSEIDPLTELANRRLYEQCLEEDINHMVRAKSPMSLMLIDIDHFKMYNDHYGHDTGDVTLKAVAQVIKKMFPRKTDLAARFGGEEFVALLPATDAKGAYQLAEKIREGIEALAIKHEFSITTDVVTVSIGIACLESAELNKADLVRCADKALYKAKDSGRNQTCVYGEPQSD
jgi:diguanylate cyclase (GGDEF)-like protein